MVGTGTYTWDAANNVTEIKQQNATPSTLEDFTYTYNAANLITSETDNISGTPTTTNYTYDASNQLLTAGSLIDSYDANGNRTMAGYVTGKDNQITDDGTWTYTYDPAGNVVQKVGDSGGSMAGYTWQYAFDNANRMTSATEIHSGSVVVQELNYYAVNGNRVEQDVTSGGTTTVTHFAYDLAGNVLADLNSSNAVVTRRLFLDATDSVFARIASGGTLDFYLSDHLGSIRGLENTSGTLDDAISYDAWGNITSESSPANGDRYKFTGREWDSDSGLQYNRARYYDPIAGRWISDDPIGFAAGDTNLYRYVTDSPVDGWDPTGLLTLQEIIRLQQLLTKEAMAGPSEPGSLAGPALTEAETKELDAIAKKAANEGYANLPHPLATRLAIRGIKTPDWIQPPKQSFKPWDRLGPPPDTTKPEPRDRREDMMPPTPAPKRQGPPDSRVNPDAPVPGPGKVDAPQDGLSQEDREWIMKTYPWLYPEDPREEHTELPYRPRNPSGGARGNIPPPWLPRDRVVR